MSSSRTIAARLGEVAVAEGLFAVYDLAGCVRGRGLTLPYLRPGVDRSEASVRGVKVIVFTLDRLNSQLHVTQLLLQLLQRRCFDSLTSEKGPHWADLASG
jgi:hypothetical protein